MGLKDCKLVSQTCNCMFGSVDCPIFFGFDIVALIIALLSLLSFAILLSELNAHCYVLKTSE